MLSHVVFFFVWRWRVSCCRTWCNVLCQTCCVGALRSWFDVYVFSDRDCMSIYNVQCWFIFTLCCEFVVVLVLRELSTSFNIRCFTSFYPSSCIVYGRACRGLGGAGGMAMTERTDRELIKSGKAVQLVFQRIKPKPGFNQHVDSIQCHASRISTELAHRTFDTKGTKGKVSNYIGVVRCCRLNENVRSHPPPNPDIGRGQGE